MPAPTTTTAWAGQSAYGNGKEQAFGALPALTHIFGDQSNNFQPQVNPHTIRARTHARTHSRTHARAHTYIHIYTRAQTTKQPNNQTHRCRQKLFPFFFFLSFPFLIRLLVSPVLQQPAALLLAAILPPPPATAAAAAAVQPFVRRRRRGGR